jgi:DNA polymerase-4
MPQKILHIDLDAFFCSVEENNDPSLRGVAFAVGGSPKRRGVVSSCSYAARLRGIHSAMPMARAIKLCPDLITITGMHGDYGKISHQVMDYLKTLTPLFEQVSIDEAFLDLSDIPDSGESLARSIQDYIRENFNLPCSIGVATNKLVAKIATDYGKASKRSNQPPCAITVIPQGEEAGFLAPLPTGLYGVSGQKLPNIWQRLASIRLVISYVGLSRRETSILESMGKTSPGALQG